MSTRIADTLSSSGDFPAAEGPIQLRAYNPLPTLPSAQFPAGTVVRDSTGVLNVVSVAGTTWTTVSGGGGGMAIGGAVTSGTAKSVLFVDGSGNLGQDNAKFQYNATSHFLLLDNIDSIGSVLTLGDANATSVFIGTTAATTGAIGAPFGLLFWSPTTFGMNSPDGATTLSLNNTFPVTVNNGLKVSTGTLTVATTAVGTAQTVKAILQNTTAAALNAQQYSPVLELAGVGWDSTASASKATKWGMQHRPVQTAGDPNGDLVFWYSTNAGAYSEKLAIQYAASAVTLNSNSNDVVLKRDANDFVSVFTNVVRINVVGAGQGYQANGTSFAPLTDIFASSGSATLRWTTVFGQNFYGGSAQANFGYDASNFLAYFNDHATFSWTGASAYTLSLNGWLPSQDVQRDIGSSAARWQKGFYGLASVGTAQTIGFSITNTTAALVAAQQFSPMVELLGKTWETTGGTSQTAGWSFQAQGVNNATALSELWFYSNFNGTLTKQIGFAKAGASANAVTIFNANKLSRLDLESGDARLSANNSSVQVNYNFSNSVEMNVNGSLVALALPGVFRSNLDNGVTIGEAAHRYSQVWGFQYCGVLQTVAAATSVTVDPTLGECVRVTLSATAITTLTISAGQASQVLTVEVVQDGTGGRTIPTTWVNVRFAGGTYTASAGVNAKDTLTFRYNSTDSKWDEIGRALNIS